MKSATRLFDALAQLPLEQRTRIALAFADFSYELLKANPPHTVHQKKQARFVAAVRELDDLPRAARLERLGMSKSAYHRRLRKLRESPTSPT